MSQRRCKQSKLDGLTFQWLRHEQQQKQLFGSQHSKCNVQTKTLSLKKICRELLVHTDGSFHYQLQTRKVSTEFQKCVHSQKTFCWCCCFRGCGSNPELTNLCESRANFFSAVEHKKSQIGYFSIASKGY